MIMRKIVVLFCLLSLHPAIQSQDIHFSQFYQAPLNQNPALAGAERKSEASLQYRSQWQSVADPYTTMAANVYTRLGKSNRENFFGLGANFFQDQSGDSKLRTTLAALSLAYHVRIGNNHKLGLGVSAAHGQLSVDSKALEWGSQYSGNAYNPSIDPGEVLGQAAFAYPDLSSGLVWTFSNTSGKARVNRNNYRQGSFGISVFHLNRPEYSFLGSGQLLLPKLVVHGRFLLSIPSTKLAVNPAFMFYRQGPNSETFLGGMLRYDLVTESKYTGVYKNAGVYLGAFLRTGDALVISSLFEFDQFSLGLSYDTNISALKNVSRGRGGFEISIAYIGNNSFFNRSVKTH